MTKRFQSAPNNPVQRYFSWEGDKDKGYVSWYDKENKQEVKVDFPFVFLPLDQLACVSGFNKQQKESIWSNEVRNTKSEILNVRIGKQTIAQDLYSNIKNDVKAKGGKFASSVYIAFKDENDELRIGNIKFVGASLGPWIDLQKSAADLSEQAVVIKDAKLDDSGAIHFTYPVMGVKQVSEETNQKADQLYEKLSEYINYKLGQNEVQEVSSEGLSDEETEDVRETREKMRESVSPDNKEDMNDKFDDIDDDLPFSWALLVATLGSYASMFI